MDRQSGDYGLVRLTDYQGHGLQTDKGKESQDSVQILSPERVVRE